MSRAHADLPLHYGQVPAWLYTRMGKLGVAITEAVVMEYGKNAFLQRMSDPFWFQSLGAVLGMDWHSSGITTSVMGALKQTVNQRCFTVVDVSNNGNITDLGRILDVAWHESEPFLITDCVQSIANLIKLYHK